LYGKAKLFDKFLGTQDNCGSPNETQRLYRLEHALAAQAQSRWLALQVGRNQR